MTYYTQKFTNTTTNAEIHAYGAEDAHNHSKSNQFSKDVIAYLTGKPKPAWKQIDVKAGHFASSTSNPGQGKLFVWNNSLKKWIKK